MHALFKLSNTAKQNVKKGNRSLTAFRLRHLLVISDIFTLHLYNKFPFKYSNDFFS